MGLTAVVMINRVQSLEALRIVMLRWPNVPDEVRNSSSFLTLDEGTASHLELLMTRFYVQQFLQIAGRAPVLPRRLPFAS